MNVIIDYKVGNLHNLKNALDFSAVETQLVSVADEVRKADRILLPGVGAFAPAMEQLRKSGVKKTERMPVWAGFRARCNVFSTSLKFRKWAGIRFHNNKKIRFLSKLLMRCTFISCIPTIFFRKTVSIFWDTAITVMTLPQLCAKTIYGEFSFIRKKVRMRDCSC